MTIKELYQYYKSARNIGLQLGFAPNTPLTWKYKGYVPIAAQHKIERKSLGRFKANINDIPRDKP